MTQPVIGNKLAREFSASLHVFHVESRISDILRPIVR